MEGLLSVPPDRGTIIGRALWKPRYVVVGGPNREDVQPPPPSRVMSNRSSAPRELMRVPTEGIYLSIYKSKEDQEPGQQYSINSITDCQVQQMAHRKQGPVLPTLVINIIPDPIADKLRKRRSSRTAGFTSSKETGPTTLLFRAVDEQTSLQDWARFIQQLIQPNMPINRVPLSPVTPASPTFVNPFAPRPRDPSDMQQRPGSGNTGSRPGFLKGFAHPTHSGRDRPMTFSDSPSLRSKRSDLSSATSSMTHAHMGFHNYTMHPADLPSPATTIGTNLGEYQGEFIEGWTSAQGRSSTLSSPIRERGSVSSGPSQLPSIPDAGTSPPGPRETILDRAFQLRCIPGSEREVPGEEKLTSLARFDALMRDMDDKRKQREAEEAKRRADHAATAAAASQSVSALNDHSGVKSGWDLDDDSSSEYDDDDDDDSDGPFGEADLDEDRFSTPASSARRALDYISGQPTHPPHPPRTHSARVPLSYNHEALMALSSNSGSSLRPQTGYSKTRGRPGMAARTHSQPQLATIIASSPSTVGGLADPNIPEDSISSLGLGSPPTLQRSSTEKRASNSSNKRLSFSEFTKRLSSSSSLLLVQTNTSAASSRGSNSDADPPAPQSPPPHLHHLHPRAAPQPPVQQQPQSPERDRCGWRGSVGVFGGAEGGFL
ncbi:hypothetical protein QBC35DRAFT_450553 [Podospora australis]|uniref:PH domain-containing protein n=1 Tax=Podospora australis TaxID=1536484 RepID=A0AAN6WVV0_9PEZI|nr:hypothetical protein QBC35DRAFT_450553 [Podospora australis]